ncbi:MAG: YkoF family thiamine/hydroxymethylpyrimidine-binding protein [Gammaproteobacteria bacterium]
MKITLDISMYPLNADYKPSIKAFVRQLRDHGNIEIVTNQMSTQVRGEFDAVMAAVNACMKQSMTGDDKVIFVTKCLNGDLEIQRLPRID